MFGDILSDECSVIPGSLGLLPKCKFKWLGEAKAIEKAVAKVLDDEKHGGLNIRTKELGGNATTTEIGDAICKALADELNQLILKIFADQVEVDSTGHLIPSSLKFKRRPMTLSPYDVRPGDMVCVKVDWTIASELTWKGMEKTYNAMGRPGVNRNDRFWLAIDHTVDPSINDQPKPKALIKASRDFQKEAGIKDLHGPNETISFILISIVIVLFQVK
ncbi:hypothetical protein LY90DRAFT_514822 [Neocallimastix californiae]|uniref:Uncharacterized protein n=1 Tax=Neocallimastix californiae TaxID=1754190 RepID=A0A1Y2AMM2_9FUNG|nr:hypothetical protein LY90DRAFT_514822 [Neocallimastix californiae]|eukprot:ORY23829.1 hypothetical protein LY90DRAFT_514822 [Neocallimastix californiae]